MFEQWEIIENEYLKINLLLDDYNVPSKVSGIVFFML